MTSYNTYSHELHITMAILGLLWTIISITMISYIILQIVGIILPISVYDISFSLLFTFLGICEGFLALAIKNYKEKNSIYASILLGIHSIITVIFALTFVINMTYPLYAYCSHLFWILIIPTYLLFIVVLRETLPRKAFVIFLVDLLIIGFCIVVTSIIPNLFITLFVFIPAFLILGLSLILTSIFAIKIKS